MYIHGQIPRNSTELAKAVQIAINPSYWIFYVLHSSCAFFLLLRNIPVVSMYFQSQKKWDSWSEGLVQSQLIWFLQCLFFF